MRGWAELAPYNFLHAMRLEEPADVERWRHAAEHALRPLKIEAEAVSIETPQTGIEDHFDAELNRGFASGDLPIRFFVIEVSSGGHWFGAVIDHWLADDFSCRALLQQMYATHQSPAGPTNESALVWTTARPWRWDWLAGCSSFVRQAVMFRRARRTPHRVFLDLTTRCFRTELPDGALIAIRELAKQHSATVHDVFLAAVAQTFGRVQESQHTSRRDSVGIASAMDLRRFETGAAKTGFGFLISQYAIVERRPEQVSFGDLVARIATRTRRLKAVSDAGVFAPALLLWRLVRSRRAKATLYQRGAPLVAGLSNVNLSGSWVEQAGIPEYRRIGPTGPVIPILLMITTLHGRVFIDTTYRTAAFTRPEAESLLQNFVKHLTAIRA